MSKCGYFEETDKERLVRIKAFPSIALISDKDIKWLIEEVEKAQMEEGKRK